MIGKKSLIVVAGPTAIGKTDLAIKIAVHFKTEIISADSRQFYKEMSIGTAKPSAAELALAKHHFIGSHSVTQNFTVGDFEEQGIALIEKLFEVYDTLVLVGGSGLFIKAITEGFDELPKAGVEVRAMLNNLFKEQGIEALQNRLQEVDSQYYNQVDLHNPQRLIRALEVCLSTGKPFSSFRTNSTKKRNFNIIKVGLNAEREELYERINFRVDKMLDAGLLNEVKSLLPYKNLNALNTVGYSEIFEYIDGKVTLEEAISSIKQNTRRFAKRQLTWFRKDEAIKWFDPLNYEGILEYVKQQAEL